MSMFFYYVGHTFVNSIKKLLKSWVIIFLVVAFAFGIIIGIGAATIEETAEGNNATEITEEYSEDTGIIEEELQEGLTPEQRENFVYPIIEMAIFGGFFVIVFINLYTSDKSGNSVFNMADVNFLFPSPMSPQAVLFFKTVLHILLIAVCCAIYLSFQLPNLILNLGLSAGAAISLMIAFIIAMIFGNAVSVFSYTVAASKNSKKYILPICIAILAVVAGVFFITKSATDLPYFDTAKLLFASKYSRFFPFFGWLAGATMSVLSGDYVIAAVYYLLLAGSFVGVLFIIKRIKADFYEDALAGAEKNQEKIEAAISGKQQRTKKRKKEAKETEIGRGWGASVFFTKEMYLRRRGGVAGALTKTGVTYLILAVALGAAMKFVFEAQTFAVFGFAVMVFAFFRNFQSPIEDDLQAPWLRLTPEDKYKKIFFSLLGGIAGAVIDAVPAFVISAVLLDASSEALIWFVVFATFEFFISACALAADAIIPDKLHPSIKKMFCVYFRMFIVVPGAFLLALGLATGNFTAFALITVLVNVLLGTGFFFLGAGVTLA